MLADLEYASELLEDVIMLEAKRLLAGRHMKELCLKVLADYAFRAYYIEFASLGFGHSRHYWVTPSDLRTYLEQPAGRAQRDFRTGVWRDLAREFLWRGIMRRHAR